MSDVSKHNNDIVCVTYVTLKWCYICKEWFLSHALYSHYVFQLSLCYYMCNKYMSQKMTKVSRQYFAHITVMYMMKLLVALCMQHSSNVICVTTVFCHIHLTLIMLSNSLYAVYISNKGCLRWAGYIFAHMTVKFITMTSSCYVCNTHVMLHM